MWECRNCGHVVVGTSAPEVCPVCKHPQAFFEVRNENYWSVPLFPVSWRDMSFFPDSVSTGYNERSAYFEDVMDSVSFADLLYYDCLDRLQSCRRCTAWYGGADNGPAGSLRDSGAGLFHDQDQKEQIGTAVKKGPGGGRAVGLPEAMAGYEHMYRNRVNDAVSWDWSSGRLFFTLMTDG